LVNELHIENEKDVSLVHCILCELVQALVIYNLLDYSSFLSSGLRSDSQLGVEDCVELIELGPVIKVLFEEVDELLP